MAARSTDPEVSVAVVEKKTLCSDNMMYRASRQKMQKSKQASIREKNNIPGGSLGPGVLLKSGHTVHVQLRYPYGLGFTSHWGDKRILEIERKPRILLWGVQYLLTMFLVSIYLSQRLSGVGVEFGRGSSSWDGCEQYI